MPAAKYTPYGIDDLADFKVWSLQNPNALKLLKEIIYQWRGSNAKVKGKPGRWAVWPIQRWAEWAGLSSDQTERALRHLVLEGLILRERHRWAGTEVRAFIQPTPLALQYKGRPGDIARLAGNVGKLDAGAVAGTGAGTGAGTDYTSIPSSPTKSSKKKEVELLFGEGKGKAAAKGSPSPQTLTPQSPPLQPGADAFPILKGKHEKVVRHPSELYENWSSFSFEVQSNLYAKYTSYVANWHKSKKSQPHAPVDEMTDEEWAKVGAQIAAGSGDDEEAFIAAYTIPKKAAGV
ncbi:hypothetical protein BV96_04597 [Sphingomonas paucimobilis]|nr:hypothetical protein BV96_04597 [Sphingomonas paucimobilis]